MTKAKIDQIAIAAMSFLSLTIVVLLWGGRNCGEGCWFHSGARVRHFSWENKTIGTDERGFILTFDRPMDRESVVRNLSIEPPLAGKISWVGRKMAYTLTVPVPYGIRYQVSLQGARERFTQEGKPGKLMRPFVGEFTSRDRAFAYIGVAGEEEGRLIFYNWSQEQKTILTPDNLVVTDYKFAPDGQHIFFFAAERQNQKLGILDNKLYSVTTGSNLKSESANNPGEIELILDNQNHQNLQFQVSPDGQTFVIQRMNRKNPGEFGLWVLKPGEQAKPLANSQGGDFLIAPDSQTVAIAQGQGISLLTLAEEEENSNSIDFLPKFGKVLSFSQDGTAAVMVDFNTDNPELLYTRSLFWVNNQGVTKKLLDTKGSILDCQFNYNNRNLYCLITKLEPETYIEQPYFTVIDLEKEKVFPILALPNYKDVHMSIASDGLGLLFEQVITAENSPPENILRTSSGETIASSRLWLLLLPSVTSTELDKPQLEQLPFLGLHPQWLP